MKRELDLVILSDIHLGTYGCHAKELLTYLKNIKVGALVLNGDFIDMTLVGQEPLPSLPINALPAAKTPIS